jgi:hypothetical protein
MFIGHFAAGFASKRIAPRASLGWLIAAPLLLDGLWPFFLAAGWEQVRIEPGNTAFSPLAFLSYPISHSLALAVVWGILCGVLYWGISRYRTGAMVIAAGVVSHWAMDAIVHRPDLPLYPGSHTFIGLGLWNSIPGTIAVEGLLYATGLRMYTRGTIPLDRRGRWGFWSMAVILAVLYALSIGQAPPSVAAVRNAGFAAWIFPFWAAWFDRHRRIFPADEPIRPVGVGVA